MILKFKGVNGIIENVGVIMIKQFKETNRVIYNPYIGFTSFQHFRNEALYSDCIVGHHGIAGCETEDYECYPVTEGVEELGRLQGFYPDTTVAYIRILWKEFEPKRGEYNYDIIEKVLEKAREKGQTVMFRLMPHSTCERDDVPDWLKEIMPCPNRPKGMRVKDSPTDPRYLKLFGKAIEKIGERFDSNPTLDCMDVSLGGSWGEGHQGFPPEAEKALMDIYLRVFKNTKLLGQIGNPEMLNYIGATRPIGWRGDGTGSPKHMKELFPEYKSKHDKEFWKTAPVSFESYWWITEWERHGWDIDSIINDTLNWHVSTFNNKSFPIPNSLKPNIERWLKKMGYRFVINEISHANDCLKGEKLTIKLNVSNVGVAPIYNKIPFNVKLKNNSEELVVKTDIDITKWLPGSYEESIEVIIPTTLASGEYLIEVSINGENLPTVNFANDIERDGEYFILSLINIK